MATTLPEVADPVELGLDPARLAALVDRARREIDTGVLPSCQLALARHGRLALSVTLGDAEATSRYVVFSCTKAIVGSVAWILIAEGALDPGMRVVDLVPEFGTNGKEVVTLEQLMTHTSGFPNAPMGPPEWFTREGRLARFGQWRLEFEPGSRFWYHPTAAHWVIAELVERAAGMDYRRFVAERVTGPLGLPRLQVGVPVEEQGDITELEVRGEPATADELEAVLGVREMPVTEVTDAALVSFNEPEVRALGVPGGGGVASAADLALFYQALLHHPVGIWDPAVLADGTGNVRVTLPDPFQGYPANRTLGIIVAGGDGRADRRGFGRTAGPRTFGHNGAAGQIAWADPDTGISFCYATNGIDANILRQGRRGIALASLAAACAA